MVDSFRISPVIQKTSTGSSDSNNDNVNNRRDDNNNQKNWRDDPNCWYFEYFVCDKNGKCDSENFDCVTDCDDGSSVTTGFPCPGEKDEGVPDGSDRGVDYEADDPCNYYGQNVCDENGECDTENFDCITDCPDGSSVTTGESCPGENNDRDEPEGIGDKPDNEPYCDEVPSNYGGYCWERESEMNEDQADDSDNGCQEDDEFCDSGCEDPNLVCEYEDEKTSNCGGEPCTPTEKEDSSLDDESYYDEEGEVIDEEEDDVDTEEEDTDEEDALYG